ncbi:THUMP domain-containing class I SAM-dependent RNA methyltransferase [Facklamia miroungae]|uniref:Putative N6-adenine-specific DNA methylase n=1 Tax=Facklamia miroungae TaxID=120956 RepID=A0A1G7QYR9_9LACT|nr:class I SAM-dependent RNA methyltransferase [Facklamia miroungae]NKZ29115.1 class I SAM-dependent RNA methyltransferase [Facklamia miroungae]SDG03682.1 putative N6-adenine-specific DNA methylase [Facklamia miroungae]
MKNYNLIATAAAGIEGIVNQELKKLGYETQTENGRVRFSGTAQDIAKTNLWLRTADRIKINIAEFKASSFEELFDQTYAIAWEDILPMDAEFPVSGKSVKSQLYSVPNCQRIVKKAIAKRLMDYYARKMPLSETGNYYPIEISLLKDMAMITLDTSGTSLFKRGYRTEKGGAPLKENMAAALVKLTTWFPDRPLYDPTCGSGTILIEAALMGRNIAPGLNRSFAAEKWEFFNPEVWPQEKADARRQINHEIELNIFGSDIDGKMIEIARQNAENAGVGPDITFKQMQLKDYRPDQEYGILISNPPYGDRLLDEEKVRQLYQDMGDVYRPMTTWSKYFLSSDDSFEKYYGEKASKKRKLYNGALKVNYYQYWSKNK